MATNKVKRDPPNITWKHSWSSEHIQNALTQSPFQTLPTEIMVHIFKYLSVYDLGNISSVCRSFKMIADQDEIWKVKCNSSTKLYSKSFKEIYMDWMYEKYLRNIELQQVEVEYLEKSSHFGCGLRTRLPRYPMRPQGKHDIIPIRGFKQHPNESQDMTIELSVDIDKTAHELISLLKKASQFKDEWRQSSNIKQMIKRYYRFMQLKASYPNNTLLIPTLDIEIIWQTHLLRPEMYKQDCLRLFHQIIDHSLLSNDIEQFLKDKAFIDTCHLYEQKFKEQYCPLPSNDDNQPVPPKYIHPIFGSLKCVIPIYSYWDKTYYKFSSDSTVDHDENPFSFTEADIILDGNWVDLCQRFMVKIMLKTPIERNHDYFKGIHLSTPALRRLKKSYERFLYMSTKYPPSNGYELIHPTYAIDIIWHSHMQEPIKYASDCIRLVGYIIDHAPWPSAHQDKMQSSCNDILNIWKKEFESDMLTDHLYNTCKDGHDSYSD